MKELIEYARRNPGMKWGHSGKATPGYLSMTLINKTEKTGFIDVTFDGDAKLIPAVLGNHVPTGIVGFAGIKSLYDSKKVKLLAFVTIPKRASFAPEVPTFTELGYTMTTFPYQGLFAPRGVPDEVVKKIDEAVSKVAKNLDFQNVVKDIGAYFNYENTVSFEKSLMGYKEAYHSFLKEEGMVK
jgi:tripartite-type tricarboxylate transporter receptor subunit TctC